jgi:hypothetical protein
MRPVEFRQTRTKVGRSIEETWTTTMLAAPETRVGPLEGSSRT